MASFQSPIAIIIVFYINFINGLIIRNEDSGGRLIWAPLKTVKSPFVTFTNDFNYPSWTTKHPMTKENDRVHLTLPKGIPFALVCGGCFLPSALQPNLTISVSDHQFVSVPKIKGDRTLQYSEGLNKCMMTYLITEAIKKDGVITCTLDRKRLFRERVTFDAVQREVEPVEDFEIPSSDTPIELHCPRSPEAISRKNPMATVWHEEIKPSDSKSVGYPIVSTKPTLIIDPPKHTITLMCSVYSLFSSGKVVQRRYKIHGPQNSAKSEYHVSTHYQYEEADEGSDIIPPKINLSSGILGIVIIAAVVCLLLGFMATYRFCSALRAK